MNDEDMSSVNLNGMIQAPRAKGSAEESAEINLDELIENELAMS